MWSSKYTCSNYIIAGHLSSADIFKTFVVIDYHQLTFLALHIFTSVTYIYFSIATCDLPCTVKSHYIATSEYRPPLNTNHFHKMPKTAFSVLGDLRHKGNLSI